MATLKGEDPAAENDLPTEEDTVEELPHETPERQHADTLIDISERAFLKELEPFEYHCNNGWEEAVRGWARVHPLSCILLTPKSCTKGKQKEAATPTPIPSNPTPPSNADISSRTVKHHSEWKNGPQKSTQLTTCIGTWNNTAVAALKKDTWPFLHTLQGTTSNPLHKEKDEQEGMLRETHHSSTKYSVYTRPCKPQKYIHRPNSTMISIKNLTFLPPINPSHLHTQGASGKIVLEGGTTEENDVLFNNKSMKRGTRRDSVSNSELLTNSAALTSKCQTCQHNPHMFSAVSVSIPRRYQVPLSSKPDTVHHTSYLVGTHVLHSRTAASPQAHMNPNKTVCGVRAVRAVK
ncbi:uncharacterized protein LOC117810285 isoform X2 [Notolabrus celidotus]|nr:uncharacterized protein LOC117810285 isoform X2 [Notolabrus celidotus]XP_034535934.1 uncharacterized protein LOC117810285 isoform X2 [Notolabrus celidotus]